MKYFPTILLIAAIVLILLTAGCITQTDSASTEPISTEPTETITSSMLIPYPVVDIGQKIFYNNIKEIASHGESDSFYGQDAQYSGIQPAYTVSSDGLTVYDINTELTWQQSPDTNGDGIITPDDKLTLTEAESYVKTLNTAGFGGYNDWSLPTIKEQYSLIDFSGTDPSGLKGRTPQR